MPVFRFRAECPADIEKLQQALIKGDVQATVVVWQDKEHPEWPDREAEIRTDLSIYELRTYMQKVSDGHVMIQTVALKEAYTGERNYDI